MISVLIFCVVTKPRELLIIQFANLSCEVDMTVSRNVLAPLPCITLIKQILKFLNNLRNILNTDFSNDKTCLFNMFWPSNGIETQRGNQPLTWSSQIIFWFSRCDFHIVQINKLQRYFEDDVLITVLDIPVFPNITTTIIFHAHLRVISLLEHLSSIATTINRRLCYNC